MHSSENISSLSVSNTRQELHIREVDDRLLHAPFLVQSLEIDKQQVPVLFIPSSLLTDPQLLQETILRALESLC